LGLGGAHALEGLGFGRQSRASNRYPLLMPQATVKRYDSLTRTGTLVSDDGEVEYPVDGDVMDSSEMFRFLRPGQRVTFDYVNENGKQKIRNLRIGIA